MRVVPLEVPALGNRCHLVHDGARAMVVDPPRDVRLVEDAAARAEVEIVAVAHTQVHHDHVSGAPQGRPARRVTAEQVTDAVLAGSWVIDLRDRAPFAQAPLAGSVSVEHSPQLATYVGWLVPWGDDIVLLTDDPAQLDPAVSDLATIGIDGVGAHVLTEGVVLTGRYRRADWSALRTELGAARGPGRPPVVVDVRQREEWHEAHLPGAVHLPVHEVDRLGHTLPPGELWVHCRSGYRAGIAASVLQRAGRDVVHVDDAWERVAELAIPTVATAA